MSSIAGSYEGEGPNVATNNTTTPPDVGAGQLDNAKGQSRAAVVTVDRRRRVRTSSEAARAGTTISVGGGDQVLTHFARGVYIGTAGNLVCRLADDTADVTLNNLAAGVWYPFAIAIVRQTGTTAQGVLLF